MSGCATIFPVSEKMNNEKTISKVNRARWSPHALLINFEPKVCGTRWLPHPLAEIVNKKHPFVPRKKSEKKVGKGLDFVPKVC